MRLGKRQKQWIKDIPLYRQAHEVLCDGNGYCCLGVYAATQIESPWENTDTKSWGYSNTSGSSCVMLLDADWKNLGLRNNSGTFKRSIFWKSKSYGSLIALNDSYKITTEEMSQFIKDNADNIFTKTA